MARLISRGDIWIVNLEPGFGREIHKKRPALVLSSNGINQNTNYAVIIPSSSIVPVILSPEMVGFGQLPGFHKNSILLPLFVRSVDQNRLVKKIGMLPEEKIQEVEVALQLVLGMDAIDSDKNGV